ncbi:hypothetical protein [Frankia sp. R43]|uniref:hypothetical protein n=1 Tax=Frankia sp. R43 TaxID=269536 RepID=UPI0006CA30C3|nr:hypothetical protein [Frankia sp. R43]
MTGSPEPAVFDVVTALLCTAEEFPGELGDHYQAACAALGLETSPGGYTLLLGQDAGGARWTQISTDVGSVATTLSIWSMGIEAGADVDAGTVVATRPGWPVDTTIGFADRPAPHDPPDAGPVLTAPTTGWAQAGRRRAADQLTEDLADTRDPTDIEFDRLNWGDTDLEPSVRFIDLLPRAPAPDHPPVVRALRDLWRLAEADHPPPGSVRARQAAGGGRLVRASGDGWSLVANTAASALLLLDDLAGMAVDITGTDGLPRLLDALTAAAARALPPRPAKPKNPAPKRSLR